MGLKALIPGTAAYSQKHHVKYLRKKVRGHDVLLLVEWEDGIITELPADVKPEWDGWYEATNGLVFANAGEGIDPVEYYGVPVVRCHAQIGCPFSVEACLAGDFDEAGEFRYITQDGQTTKVVEMTPTEQLTPDATNGHSEVATDGGVGQVDPENMEREYDLRPPAGSIGYTFSMTQAKQRAPNPISANMIRRAVEYGKESERGAGELIKYIGYGVALTLGVLLIFLGFNWVLQQIGGGGGGSGGGVVFGLLALATPARAVATDAVDQIREG